MPDTANNHPGGTSVASSFASQSKTMSAAPPTAPAASRTTQGRRGADGASGVSGGRSTVAERSAEPKARTNVLCRSARLPA